MKNVVFIAAAFGLGTSILCADPALKGTVKTAASKLADADNYSWLTTIEATQFQPGPSHGKTEKGGFTYVDFSFQDNKIESYVKNGKGAIKGEEGWKSLDEAAKDDGDGGFNFMRFMAMRMQHYKTPAVEASDIAGKTKDLNEADGAISGDLTEDEAKELIFPRGPNGEGPDVKNAKGSVKFWLKDGVLTKYQLKVSGTMDFNGNDNDIDRTTTTEVKDVGATKVAVPDDAKAKAS